MTILSSSIKTTILCTLLTAAAPPGLMAVDYDVDTGTDGNKLWSAPSTWKVNGVEPVTIPNGENDNVTVGFHATGNIGLQLDLAEVELAKFLVTGTSTTTRSILGYNVAQAPMLDQKLTIGTLEHKGTGNLSFRNSVANARLSVEVETLIINSGAAVEIGNTNASASLSLEAFEVTRSSTIAGTLRFNNIKERAAGENILYLKDLDLSGDIALGGRGNTGGVLNVTSLKGTTSGNIHVYRSETHGGTSGTLEINSEETGGTTYSGVIREYFSDSVETGVPEGTTVVLDVRKLGIGTQIFNRAAGQLYTGGTAIEGGVLAVDNTTGSGLGTGRVMVSGTGTLAGKGRLELKAQPIEIKSGGTLAPGAHLETGVATLTISGAQTPTGPLLSLEEGSTLFFRLEGGNSDRIAFTGWHEGGLQLAAQGITIDASGVNEGRFNLLSFDAIGSDELMALAAGFNAQILGSGFDGWQGTFGYDTLGGENVLWLEVSVIPEPGSAVLTLLGLGAIGWAARLRKQKKA
ncbi:MAG TPA: PEP-CTERM sorting domain-containing protein [Chthoniobacteraceae bacterium]|nr:PEP-CTERM sorting domain-containing protein [Chthoniobacteraceae bacterium]